MTAIDARNFSVQNFADAISIDWCIDYNQKCGRRRGRRGERLYSREQVDNIFQHIVDSGILSDIDFDEQVAASIGNQLSLKMIAHCRRNRR